MASKKYYTTEELIELVEDENFWEADVFITPPDDGMESAEDSGNEDDCNDVNKLSGPQLRAPATAKVRNQGKTFRIGEDTDEESEDLNMENEKQANEIENDKDSDEEMNMTLSEIKKMLFPTNRNWSKHIDLNDTFPQFTSMQNLSEIPSDPVACFEKFFDDSVFELLTNFTVKYAINEKKDHNFTIDVGEMRCFVAILLLSGYCIVPRWRMWWEIGSEACNMSVVNSMRRNKFESIKRYLHCADNSDLPKNDKFGKMRPLIKVLNERFLKYSEFQERLSIDESMVPYFGRHGAKQFIKGKPIRYGYKMWCLCEPLGYLMKFEPYQGATSAPKNTKTKTDLGVGGSVVMKLVEELPQDKPFKIYGDRFFSSLKLVHRLRQTGFGYTGTIKYNRIEKCPITAVKLMEKEARGYYDFCTDIKNNVTVTSWNDNRIVLTVSTCDPVGPENQVNRWVSAKKKKVPVSQPFVISQYNKFMGGVDRMDENIDNYRISIRSKKWWWAVFAFCIDSSVHNAWQLYRKGEGKMLDYLTFRRTIVQVYLQKYGRPPTGGGRPMTPKALPGRVADQVRYDQSGHWIVNAMKQNRCALCKKNSTKACVKCKLNLHESCFVTFHTK